MLRKVVRLKKNFQYYSTTDRIFYAGFSNTLETMSLLKLYRTQIKL